VIISLIQSQPDAAAQIAGLIIFLLLAIVGLVVYFVPTIIAVIRNHPNIIAIMAVNLLLGWICIGWIVALVWALTAIDESRTYR
jgi:T4 superinfection immunity protein